MGSLFLLITPLAKSVVDQTQIWIKDQEIKKCYNEFHQKWQRGQLFFIIMKGIRMTVGNDASKEEIEKIYKTIKKIEDFEKELLKIRFKK